MENTQEEILRLINSFIYEECRIPNVIIINPYKKELIYKDFDNFYIKHNHEDGSITVKGIEIITSYDINEDEIRIY